MAWGDLRPLTVILFHRFISTIIQPQLVEESGSASTITEHPSTIHLASVNHPSAVHQTLINLLSTIAQPTHNFTNLHYLQDDASIAGEYQPVASGKSSDHQAEGLSAYR